MLFPRSKESKMSNKNFKTLSFLRTSLRQAGAGIHNKCVKNIKTGLEEFL